MAAGALEGASLAEAAAALQGAERAEDRALAARVDEAMGLDERAAGTWRTLLADEGTPRWLARLAALRLLALVDAVPLGAEDARVLARALGGPQGGEPELGALAEAVAARLDDAGLAALASQRRGWVGSFTRSGRLAPWPALAFDPERPARPSLIGRSGEGAIIATDELHTPDGTVAFAEEGPGLYAATVAVPASDTPWVLEVVSDAGVRVFDGARLVLESDRLGALAAGRQRASVPSGPARPIEIQVATRASAPTLRVALRPAVDAAGLAAVARAAGPPDTLLGRIARLEAALFDDDPARASRAADALAHAAEGVAAEELARFELADPSRPPALSASRARRLLEAAAARLPDDHEARGLLAEALQAAGETGRAYALLDELPTLPLRDRVLLALARDSGATADAARLADAALERVPTSCAALADVLDLRWDQLRHGALTLPARPPRCPSLEPRLAALAQERGQPALALSRLERALADAPPGTARARLESARADALWEAGDPAGSADAAL
ncbi:MAG: hypothetical protein H6744_08790, partial [Deltaproteobacteria bacterium]|nr:hypothetical protein [Deltaproteobacteria bacterium]